MGSLKPLDRGGVGVGLAWCYIEFLGWCFISVFGECLIPVCYMARVRDAKECYCEIASGLSKVSDS